MTVKKAVEALLEKGLGECALLKLRGLTHFFFFLALAPSVPTGTGSRDTLFRPPLNLADTPFFARL